ncbi:glycoside hydrolase family 30 beta sandwich domain-containing protein [Zhouia sp. PK063]|uniref:glycoside hydrolase family 30 protein n=1 Tax=Zhouia sp. PK063 TaxID=3373602 RepID=UPI0037A5FA63
MKLLIAGLFPVISVAQQNATVFTTAKNTSLKLAKTGNVQFEKAVQPMETEISVFVNPSKKFQTLEGIGGAISDASAEVFAKLSKAKQEELLKAYYSDQNGIGYSLARTNINSCDFSSDSYTYIKDGDTSLKSFNIQHDEKYKIPLIKKAFANAHALKLFVSPWSPPAFMKTNKDMLHGGKLLKEYYPAWAMYYAKFIKAYEKEGIPIWGLTIQNEPMAKQTWESCIYTAEDERDFLKNDLGPTLAKEGLADKKVIVWDHNRDLMTQRANTIFSDPDAAKYAWGLGFHWYETWTGADPLFENVAKVQEAYPNKKLVFTEGCVEKFDYSKLQYWPNGERYGEQMIHDFNNGTVAWTDWNILLDEHGGPNHVGNFCFSPVHANLQTGELIYTPSYYYIGHFSKFIRPGAKRLSTSTSRSVLMSTSFENKDGSIATVVMNKTDKEIKYNLMVGVQQETKVTIPAHAIQTIIYKTN